MPRLSQSVVGRPALLSAKLADDKLTFDSENGREAIPGSVAGGNRRSEDVGSIVQLALGSFFGKAMSVLTRTRAFDRLKGFLCARGIP